MEQFHISFKRTGGFSGTSYSAEIDSRELDRTEAEKLEGMIEHSGFFEAVSFGSSFLHMPDQFNYQLCIEHRGKKRTLELNDAGISDHLRPLINYLVGAARSGRMRYL